MTTPTAVAVRQEEPQLTPFEVIERVISSGDLSKMQPVDRVAFYWRTCESLGLNPLTRPFDFVNLSGKIVLYAKKDATDQLRRIHRVTIDRWEQALDATTEILTVTVYGHTPDGRSDFDIGAVSLKGLGGEARANAIKKAVTQGKRRLTLSLVGLGFLDESQIEGVGDRVDIDPDTGEIRKPVAKPATLLDAVHAQAERLAATESTPVAADPDPDDDTIEGQVVELTADGPELVDPSAAAAAPEPMPSEAFVTFLAEWSRRHNADQTYAAALAKRVSGQMFPGVARLNDEQRALLAVRMDEEE